MRSVISPRSSDRSQRDDHRAFIDRWTERRQLRLTHAEWSWLFAINLPGGVLALMLGARSLPSSETIRHQFDVPSALLNALMFAGLLMTTNNARLSEHHALGATAAVAAVVSGVVLFKRQIELKYSVVPVDLLADRTYRLSVLTSICCYTAQMTAYVTLPFHLQRDFGFSVLTTGFVITGWPVGVALMAPLAGRPADRYSPALLGTLGLSVLAIGFLLLTTAPVGSSPWLNFGCAMVCGTGFGLFQTPNNKMLIQAAPRHRSGAASGMLATSRLFGQMCGASLVPAVFTGTFALNHGTWPLIAAAAIASLGAIASAFRLR